MRIRTVSVVLLAVCLHPFALAETFQGRVVGIADGDTVTVLDADYHQHRVRMNGIDAPEKKQPFGNVSRQHLADLLAREQVTVNWHKVDRYQRLIGKVLIGRIDAALEQIKAGLAWHYKKYKMEQSPEDRRLYAETEEAARAQRAGLWREAKPIPPWDFRHPQNRAVGSTRDAACGAERYCKEMSSCEEARF